MRPTSPRWHGRAWQAVARVQQSASCLRGCKTRVPSAHRHTGTQAADPWAGAGELLRPPRPPGARSRPVHRHERCWLPRRRPQQGRAACVCVCARARLSVCLVPCRVLGGYLPGCLEGTFLSVLSFYVSFFSFLFNADANGARVPRARSASSTRRAPGARPMVGVQAGRGC